MYLCCNQLKGCWEVINRETKQIIFTGTYDECKEYTKNA